MKLTASTYGAGHICDDVETDEVTSVLPDMEGSIPPFRKAIEHARQYDDEFSKSGAAAIKGLMELAEFAADSILKKKSTFELLNRDEICAIHAYTQESSLYKLMNARLRGQDRSSVKPFSPYIRLLLSALYKLPSVEKTNVFRGVKVSIAHAFKNNQQKIWWTFTSTTTSSSVLQNDMFLGKDGNRTMFMIETSFGVDVCRYSAIKSEKEVLVLPGSVLLVADTPLDLGHGLHQVHLKQTKRIQLMGSCPLPNFVNPSKWDNDGYDDPLLDALGGLQIDNQKAQKSASAKPSMKGVEKGSPKAAAKSPVKGSPKASPNGSAGKTPFFYHRSEGGIGLTVYVNSNDEWVYKKDGKDTKLATNSRISRSKDALTPSERNAAILRGDLPTYEQVLKEL